MGKYIDDADVLPHGKYALIRNLTTGDPAVQLTSAAQLISIATTLGLRGFAFALFDSTNGPATWNPSPGGTDLQQVQWLFNLPGLVQALKDAGLAVVGYSGGVQRTSIANEVGLARWVQNANTKIGPVLNVTAWVFDLTGSDWSNDTTNHLSGTWP